MISAQDRSLQRLRAVKSRLKKAPKHMRLKRAPRMIEPKSQIREYARAIKAMNTVLRRTYEHVFLNQLPHLTKTAQALRPEVKKDSWADPVKQLITALRVAYAREFSEDEINAIALKAGISVSELSLRNLNRVWQTVLEINPLLDQPYLGETLKAFASLNTTLIQSVSERFFGELEQITYKGLINGTLYSDMADEIASRFGVADSRAELIARDQSSKLNGQLNELRQSELGVDKYVWRTSLDERVRESHAEKEGEEFAWEDPPSDTGNPGDDINCRCYGEPVLTDLFGQNEEASLEPSDQESP